MHYPCVLAISLLVVPAALASRVSHGDEISIAPSPLSRIAADLTDADPEQRTEFARIAVEEMIAEYAAVASEARGDSSPRRASRRARWSSAVETYVSQLRQALRGLENWEPVTVAPSDGNAVHLKIGDQPLIVTGPRLDRPDGLAWRILERYCSLAICPDTTFDGIAAVPLPHGVWSYGEGQGPTVSTPQGVHCVFRDLSNRVNKELFCRGLVRDLGTLERALQRTGDLGFPVEWQHLEISRGVDGEKQTVRVNGRGDYLRLSLPILLSVPELREDALRWVESRLTHRRAQLLVADADRFVGGGNSD